MPLSIVQAEYTKQSKQKSRKVSLDFNSTRADQDSEVSITDILENEIESQVCNSKLYDLQIESRGLQKIHSIEEFIPQLKDNLNQTQKEINSKIDSLRQKYWDDLKADKF